jgi:putative transposase
MARQWRIEYEGAIYHVLSRGNERRNIIGDDEDRKLFLNTLGRMCERFGVEVYVYVLMDNHYHLLLRTTKANLSRSMQWFAITYTRHFNLRYSRSGHLFQGRFKSFLIEDDSYLMMLSCYIHRNPLRAGVVKRLADYRWSSYPAYAYGKYKPAWLNVDLVLSYFNVRDKRSAYREAVQKYAGEKGCIWEGVRYGLLMGSKEFVDRIKSTFLSEQPHLEIPQQKQVLKRQEELSEVLAEAATLLKYDSSDFLKSRRLSGSTRDDRDLLVYYLWETGLYKNREIAGLFGITYSAISHIVNKMKLRLKRERFLKKRFNTLNSLFKM